MQKNIVAGAAGYFNRLVVPLIALILIFLCSCSPKRLAINAAANTLSSSSSDIMFEDDPELVRDAMPFTMKMYETILSNIPEHKGLLLETSKMFTLYAYAFLMMEAEMIDNEEYKRAQHLRARAFKLFLRARDYTLRGLESNHKGFRKLIREDYESALAMTDTRDTALLYWCGAAWAGALTAAKDNLELLLELPIAVAMVGKVLTLDETFDNGAAHDFFVSYYGSQSEAMGGSKKKAREHFKRSIAITGGKRAGTYISLAGSVSVADQDVKEYRRLLNKALEIDADLYPEYRLSNIISQRKARWLLDNVDLYFLIEDKDS